jgi:5-hydroxyisourate hydrolase
MARLSTHVLDTSRGVPAAGVTVEVHVVNGGERRLVTRAVTNAEGRTAKPLVEDDRIEPGVYELTFGAADYFRRSGVALEDPPFLGDVVLRVGIADAQGHYHVPLLLSPYAYSTYRGS